MGLHRRVAEEERFGDLGVGPAPRQEGQDLDLARRQSASAGAGSAGADRPPGELLDEAPRDARSEQRLAGGDDADRGDAVASAGASLSRKPLAPARSASKTYSSRSNVVRISTRVDPPPPSRRRRVASIPSRSGMRTSISTTSGRSAAAQLDRLERRPPPRRRLPGPARNPRSGGSRPRSSAWSSAMRTRILAGRSGVPGALIRPKTRSAGAPARRSHRPPAVQPRIRPGTGRLAPASRPDPVRSTAPGCAGGPVAVVGHLDLDIIRSIADDHRDPRWTGMAQRVGERLLDDSVGGDVDPRRERTGSPSTRRSTGRPARAHLVDQRLDVGETRLGHHRLLLAVIAAQDAEQPADLGERLAAGRLDRFERRPCGLGLAVEHPAPRRGLDDHDADAVGDDVVQLARDPCPLLRHRAPGLLFALPLELIRPLLQLDHLDRPAAERIAHQPESDEEAQHEQAPQFGRGPASEPCASAAPRSGTARPANDSRGSVSTRRPRTPPASREELERSGRIRGTGGRRSRRGPRSRR